MKKLLLGMTGLILSFTLVLVGCSDNTTDLNLGSIGGPRNLQVVENQFIPGAVILTWDRVKDAETYRIVRERVRRDGVERQEFYLGSTSNTFYFDITGFNNVLENVEYRYTVYSVPSSSKDVLEGSDARHITLQGIPSRSAGLGLTADGAVPLFDTDRKVINGSEVLIVTFEQLPIFTYDVVYNYGIGTELIQQISPSDADAVMRWQNQQTGQWQGDGNDLANTSSTRVGSRAVSFPLIGGDNTITVIPRFRSTGFYDDPPPLVRQTGELTARTLDTATITRTQNMGWDITAGTQTPIAGSTLFTATREVNVIGYEIWVQRSSNSNSAQKTYEEWTRVVAHTAWNPQSAGSNSIYAVTTTIPAITAGQSLRFMAIAVGGTTASPLRSAAFEVQ